MIPKCKKRKKKGVETETSYPNFDKKILFLFNINIYKVT